jgi:hypothetical protein
VSFLYDEFQQVQQAISSGAFDPYGSNYTSFSGPSGPLNLQPGAFPGVGGKTAGASLQPSSSGGDTSTTASPPTSSNTTSGNPAAISSSWQSFASGYFGRAVVIVLGFVFVAAGLHMFSGGQVVQMVRR